MHPFLIAGLGLFVLGVLVLAVKSAAKEKARSIVIIDVSGVIKESDKRDSSFAILMEELKKAEETKPPAVILKINSPGGTVAATEEIADQIGRLRKAGIKVVAKMGDVAASGGLWVAMACDYIVASAGTITGSIGVIIQSYDLSELLTTLMIKANVIKSGASKDILSPTRPVTDEEKTRLGVMVMRLHGAFCRVVYDARGHKLGNEMLEVLADGRPLTGSQAREVGLIDQIGSLHDAIAIAEDLAKIPAGTSHIVRYPRKSSLNNMIRGVLPGSQLEEEARALLAEASMSGIPLLLMKRL